MSTANGIHTPPLSSQPPLPATPLLDRLANGADDVPLERLEVELPVVDDGQVPMQEIVSRLVQTCYAELSELAETLPNMSDAARKRKLADFVVAWKKQVVKLYAVVKWSRDAHVVQKCMNVTAFFMDQNRQFEDVTHALSETNKNLDQSRLRNHDLLTSLDVLTTGTYWRLPTIIKDIFIPPKPLTDDDIAQIFTRMESLVRYRLRMHEVIPIEMSNYRIADGRVFFSVPNTFEASLGLLGGQPTDGWFFVDAVFLFNVGGDPTGMQDFPRKPTGDMMRALTAEADNRLGFYIPNPEEPPPPPGQEPPPKKELPEGVVDAPLVRLFNFLQMMSMTYQLEILWYQAERLRSLGWADYLSVVMAPGRRSFTISYWIRKPPPPPQPRLRLPPLGGTLTLSLVDSPTPRRAPASRVLADLQARAKLAGRRASDDVESVRWEVKWAPVPGALGVKLFPEDAVLREGELEVDAADLDMERLLRRVIEKHTRGIFKAFLLQLRRSTVFSLPDAVALVENEGQLALRTLLCADETAIVTIDPRTGRLSLRDTGDFGAAGRGPRFSAISEKLNENPGVLLNALVRLRMNTIIELAEQKANYLGLQTYRARNFSREEFAKLGPTVRIPLYIQLAPYPAHYLVLVVTDDDFRYGLIQVSPPQGEYHRLVIEDIGWLDVNRICVRATGEDADGSEGVGGKRKREAPLPSAMDSKFKLETQVLRELYAYCCELQFKNRQIPYTHVYPSSGQAPAVPPSLASFGSSLSQTIPALCVQSSDILAGSQAFEAAMPNIRVLPLAWWAAPAAGEPQGDGERPPQVVTCVKLKYVQQPVGRRAGAARGRGVIRPSKRIVYDASEAVVCFLADEVEGCVDMFLNEWRSVSKIVVIAREVAQMAKRWKDVRLVSFDLQTVEFAYASDYVLSITCNDPADPSGGSFNLHFSRLPPPPPSWQDYVLSITCNDPADPSGGSFNLHFSRLPPSPPPTASSTSSLFPSPSAPSRRPYNPHTDAEPFFLPFLKNSRLSACLPALVDILRNTVPILEVLEEIRAEAEQRDAAGGAEAEANWSWSDVDTYPKSAGWWRVAFGVGAPHALDFRLLKGARVAVVDGSHSFQGGSPPTPDRAQDALLLQPIPRFGAIVERAARAAAARARRRGSVAAVDVGVVCDVGDAAVVGRELWAGIVKDIGKPASA
ncbi:mediator complex subunit MED14-domain-containing protein [Amylostereum chailletii]|nr:mediator complex subunit MED14-domain-containing protein [Amylostereum chailletii]